MIARGTKRGCMTIELFEWYLENVFLEEVYKKAKKENPKHYM